MPDHFTSVELLRNKDQALRNGFRIIEEAHRARLDDIVIQKSASKKTINYNTQTLLRDLEIDQTGAVKLQEYQNKLNRMINKMILNSVYGPAPVLDVKYTVSIFSTHGEFPHRIQFDCTNHMFLNIYITSKVSPWIEENISGAYSYINDGGIGFADHSDAVLCYVRFR